MRLGQVEPDRGSRTEGIGVAAESRTARQTDVRVSDRGEQLGLHHPKPHISVRDERPAIASDDAARFAAGVEAADLKWLRGIPNIDQAQSSSPIRQKRVRTCDRDPIGPGTVGEGTRLRRNRGLADIDDPQTFIARGQVGILTRDSDTVVYPRRIAETDLVGILWIADVDDA